MLKLYVKAKTALIHFHHDESGATAIEYGLFAALIGAVIVGTVATLGGGVNTGFVAVCDAIAENVDGVTACTTTP